MRTMTRRELFGSALRGMLERIPRIPAAAGEKTVPGIAEVDPQSCTGMDGGACRTCLSCCPVAADVITWEEKPLIDATRCTGCAVCERVCRTVNPPGAIQMVLRRAAA